MQGTFQGYEQMSKDLDLEFMPAAYPGFDDRDNEKWGEGHMIEPGYYRDYKNYSVYDDA
ncbi:MAG: hypothetical protein ACOC1K_04785 [Nanoarchaeota archaeon]